MLNKYNVSITLIILGFLYFFSLFFAQGSPVFKFLTEYASIAFGEIGLNIFFFLAIASGILILIRWYLMSSLLKQSALIMVFVSAILNFSILDSEWSLASNVNSFSESWWFLSRPLLRGLNNMFWGQTNAIKILIIILFILVIIWILYSRNFSIPRIKVNMKKYERPERTKSTKTTDTVSSRKENKETNKKTYKYHNENNTSNNSNTNTNSTSSSGTSGIMKSIIKQKITQKEKELEVQKRPKIHFSGDKPTFPANLIQRGQGKVELPEAFLLEKSDGLQNKLSEFNVPVSVEGFDIWPSIIQLKIKPDTGIKIANIENLANDIKLSMKSKSLRIVAPIPWTEYVGIQIPNPKPVMVKLGEILESPEFQWTVKKEYQEKHGSSVLALGKGIDGQTIVKSLDEMPHLLIAGATGSGKSVGVNDFILSLMYQNTPAELKFLMIDPKQVELELYSGLPYMLWPIISDSEKALKLLKWAVMEMERRYTLLKEKRVKNIKEYNERLISDKMFRIVIVIDELADMMMHKNKKEVEICITRIAQKARAVGMHLIVATQRPSVNVITGLIKANIPTRIAFGVVSEIDSRTILGRKGAEDLLGKWDLLYIDPKTKRPIRIQAPFIATNEIENIVKTLKNKYMQGLSEDDIYNPEIIQALEDKLETISWWTWSWWWSDEELVQQAIQIISQTRKASATMLQRKLNVGFARAARIMDILEERGIIWPQDWARPREILI